MDNSQLTCLDEETVNLSKKSRSDIIEIDLDDFKSLGNKSIFIGSDASKEIKQN